MKNDVHAISLSFRCSRSYLSLKDKVTLYLDIINNLDVPIKNVNIQTFFDNKYLRMVENIFNCNDNRSSIIKIDKIGPLEHTRIECSLELYYIPKELKLPLFSKVSYNAEIDGEFVSDEVETNIINIKIYNIKIENFIITSNKKFYTTGEIIEYTINVSNIGNVTAQNILIKDFIPENTTFIENSIKFLGDGELFFIEKGLLINKIAESSTIKINFMTKINSNIQNDYIKNKAILEYKDYSKDNLNGKINKIESNLDEVFINSGAIFSNKGAFIHKVDKEIAYLNEIINHKIVINNQNKVKIKRACFKDEKNQNLEYIKNTLTINGIPKNYENIYEGVILEDINLGEVIITYKTKAIDVPESSKVNLNSKIYYVIDNECETSKELSDKCEENSFFIYGAIIKKQDFKRHQDKNLIAIGETIDCALEIKNSGNLDAINLILKENIISEMSLVEDSFFINSKKIKKINLNEDIEIGCLKPKESINIKYKLRANIFIKEFKDLSSSLKYECLLLNGNIIKENIKSNILSIKVEGADLTSLKKEVDKKLCKVNDILSFNLSVKNKGNVEALDIKIKDKKNEYLEFLENSLYLNNNLLKNENIYEGIWKDILEIGEELNLSYKAKVISLPESSYIFSKSNLSFIHLINDKSTLKNGFEESNDLKIVVINPSLIIKDINAINKDNKPVKYSIDNNEIPFKLLIKNNGNMLINELEFLEIISDELEFISSSFKINDKVLDDSNFFNGFKIKNLDSQEYIEISFILKPRNNENLKDDLKVKSTIKYKFIDSLSEDLKEEIVHFEEDIFIIRPKLKVIKEVNKTLLAEGEEVTETLTLSNMGNFDLEDIEVYLPIYEFLEPRKGTLNIDNSIIEDFPIDNKILIKKLSSNEIKKISLRHKILNFNLNNMILKPSKVIGKVKIKDVNILDNVSAFSNSINISAIKNSIILEQNFSSNTVLSGDDIRYFLNIKNTGNTIYKNAILDINIPKGLINFENAIYINSSLRDDIINLNKIPIGDIKVNEVIKISIIFNVNKDIEASSLKLNSNINGECILLNKYSDYREFKSNDLNLKIEKCKVNLYRSSNITSVEIGDRILINSVISNEGSLDLKDIVFYEEENSFLDFIEDSLKINNKSLCLNESIYNGVNIGDIKKGDSVVLECEYEYINGGLSGVIETFSSIDFSRINPTTLSFERFNIKSNSLNIEKAMSLFKTMNINGEIEISESDPKILEVSNLIINPSILSYYPIETIKNRSYDNQILTGKKMIIEGIVEEKIEYIVDDEFSALYFIEKITPFSTFIVMPENNDYDNIDFECKTIDVYFTSIDSRTIFRDINFIIEGY